MRLADARPLKRPVRPWLISNLPFPRSPISVLLVPALVYLVVFFAFPLGQMLLRSVFDPEPTLKHYQYLLATPVYWQVLLNTFRIAVFVTAISLVLGYPVAYYLANLSPGVRGLLLILVLLPFWTSFLVRSFSWIILLQNTGVINRLLQSLGLIGEPIRMMYNATGVYIGMVHIMLPYAILAMLAVMQAIDRGLVRAAQTLGATPFQAFMRVYFPLSLPGLAAAGLLVFINALGFFITPALLGGPGDIMLAQTIEQQVNRMLNWGFGATLSLLLLVATLVVYLLYDRFMGLETMWGAAAAQGSAAAPRSSATTESTSSDELQRRQEVGALAALRPLPPRRPPAVRLPLPAGLGGAAVPVVSVLILLYLTLPMLIIVPMSFGDSTFLEFPPKGFSLRWYETYFTSLPWTSASLRSIQVGLLSAALATVLGTLASFALVRGRLPGKRAINAFILSPMILPRMVIAIAVYFLYARLNLVGTAEGLVLAHVVLGVPFVVVTVSAVLKGFDLTLEHAAQTLGANRWQTFRHVTLPLIQAGVLSGALFAFITSFDELIIALFVTGGVVSTLPKKMWDDILLQVNPTLAAVSTVLLVLTTALLLTAELLRRRAERLKGAASAA